MKKLHLPWMLAVLLATLGGCAQNSHYTPSGSTANSSSGVTVYGDIDTSIVRTR